MFNEICITQFVGQKEMSYWFGVRHATSLFVLVSLKSLDKREWAIDLESTTPKCLTSFVSYKLLDKKGWSTIDLEFMMQRGRNVSVSTILQKKMEWPTKT